MKNNRKRDSRIQFWLHTFVQFATAISFLFLLNVSSPIAPVAFAYDPHFRLPWSPTLPPIAISGYTYNQGTHIDRTGYPDYYAIDFGLGPGTAVLAAQGGFATRGMETGTQSYGNFVTINHGNGFSTLYAHLQTFSIPPEGRQVAQGEQIGTAGATGTPDQPHLHFSARFTDANGIIRSYMPEPMSGYTGFGNYGTDKSPSPNYTNGPQYSNVLKNGSFDDDPIMWEAIQCGPPGAMGGGPWQRYNTTCWGVYSDTPHDGPRYLEMSTGSASDGAFWQNVPFYSNEYSNYTQPRTFINTPDTWTFRIWVRARCGSGTGRGSIGIWALDPSGAGEARFTQFNATADWQAVTATTVFYTFYHNYLQVLVNMNNSTCNYDFDGATLQRNYIITSSFEEVNLSPWQLNYPTDRCVAYMQHFHYTYSSTNDDDYFLRANRGTCDASAGYIFLYQDVDAYPALGDIYRARVWIRQGFNQTLSGIVKLKAYGGSAPEEFSERPWTIYQSDTSWHDEFDVTLRIALSGHTRLRIELFLNDQYCPVAQCQYDFDGVQVWGGAEPNP